MSDNSATAVYRGTGLTTSGWTTQESAEDRDSPEVDDLTDGQDPDAVRLEGGDGETEGFGRHAGGQVPNLNVTHLSNPAKTHGLPSNLAANPLTAARPRAHR